MTTELEVCLGSAAHIRAGTVEELCGAAVAAFWGSQFNAAGMVGCIQMYLNNNFLGDYREWQRKTKNCPKWCPGGKSLLMSHVTYDFFTGSKFRNRLFIDGPLE